MTDAKRNSGLVRALALSQELLSAAEQANVPALGPLDAERRQLLESFRLETKQVHAPDRALLQQISGLNERTIGLVEHLKRGKGREMDMAAAGRRAVAAYSGSRAR